MRIRQLEAFVRVCELGSITRAARDLNLAQPAIGLQIRNLEEAFQVQLLVRHSHGVTPTKAGELLMQRARSILQQTYELTEEMAAFRARSGKAIRLGMTPSLSGMISARLVLQAREAKPALEFNIIEDMGNILTERLLAGEVEIALMLHDPQDIRFDVVPILRDSAFFITKPGTPFDQPGPIPLSEVARIPLALAGPKVLLRRQIDAAMTAAGLCPEVEFEIDSICTKKDLVMQGLASSITSYGVVRHEVESGEIVARVISPPGIYRTVYLVTLRGAPIPLAFDNFLEDFVADLTAKQQEPRVYEALPGSQLTHLRRNGRSISQKLLHEKRA